METITTPGTFTHKSKPAVKHQVRQKLNCHTALQEVVRFTTSATLCNTALWMKKSKHTAVESYSFNIQILKDLN